mgnify:CR=1 FL=1
MLNFLLENSSGSGTSTSSFNWISIIMIVVMIAALYFLMIRPQKKQQKKDDEMRSSLAVGDEVTTIGGIIGKVVSIKDETFVLETTKDRTKIRFLKGAIRTIDVKAEDIAASVMEQKAEGAEGAAENAEAASEPTADEKKDENK